MTWTRSSPRLICHMLDVAAVAEAIWRDVLSPGARRHLAAGLGLGDEGAAERWAVFLAALHDLGKACPAFQLRPAAAPLAFLYRDLKPPPPNANAPHGIVTALELPALLVTRYSMERAVANDLAAVIGGHHGVLPSSAVLNRLEESDEIGRGRWREARAALVDELSRLLQVPDAPAPSRVTNDAAMLLAGLVCVADWIGSTIENFPYAVADARAPVCDVARYWADSPGRAAKALDRLGWTWWRQPREPRPFVDLFPHATPPRPLQMAAVDLADTLTPPCLVIIEAPMGEGKTEAALYLADRWGVEPGPRGFYMALPTQATTNQMFGRLRDFLARRYADERVNLLLLHGHAALSAEFQELRRNADRLVAPAGMEDEADRLGDETGLVAAEWLTHRKRGLLAPFGVGTVDQALLAVLQSKHLFVRLFGLAHSVVVIDEVHAYDTYMSALLERLLEWLAALGSPVVLLSATLPRRRREALLAAYGRGLAVAPGPGRARTPDAGPHPAATRPHPPTPSPVATGEGKPRLGDVAYPRVSWVTAGGEGARPIEASAWTRRSIELRWVDGRLPDAEGETFALGKRLRAALVGGGCAAVICNTVRRAQAVYRALRPYCAEDELDLFHARYLFKDRAAREERALARFGRDAGAARPRRAVLVATQVIEQSLDLDFDLMVTDMAPADLVLQRAGRLHRHDRGRPAGLERPVLWICAPELRDGLPHFEPGFEFVYDAHVLLRSWLALRDRTSIAIPDEVEAVIEEVYDDCPPPTDLVELVRERWNTTRAEQQQAADMEQQEALERWIQRPSHDGPLYRLAADPRDEDAPDFHQAHRALTRLAEETVSVVCLYADGDRIRLDPDGEVVTLTGTPNMALTKRLLERSVAIGDKRVLYQIKAMAVPDGWQRSALLRHHRLLLLDATGSVTLGARRLRLDDECGVVIE